MVDCPVCLLLPPPEAITEPQTPPKTMNSRVVEKAPSVNVFGLTQKSNSTWGFNLDEIERIDVSALAEGGAMPVVAGRREFCFVDHRGFFGGSTVALTAKCSKQIEP